LSSQKHRGHSRKRFSDDGDNLIFLFLNIWPAKLPNQSFAAACYVSLLKTKNPSSLFERMGSPVDNLGRYISLSSEGSWIDPLQFRIPRLLSYPPMDYVTQDISIIAFLELIVKSNKTYKRSGTGTCESPEVFPLDPLHVLW